MRYETKTYNDRSALSAGWKPAFLLAIGDEATPETWKMFEQSPRFWRWKFAVWEVPHLITQQMPERQSAISSQKFTPKGRQPASKAYQWTASLLGHQIAPGETVDLDPLMPIPCRVKIERTNEYANIVDVEPCPEIAQHLTEDMKRQLAGFLETFSQAPEPEGNRPPAPAQQWQQPQAQAQPAPQQQLWGQPNNAQQQPAGSNPPRF